MSIPVYCYDYDLVALPIMTAFYQQRDAKDDNRIRLPFPYLLNRLELLLQHPRMDYCVKPFPFSVTSKDYLTKGLAVYLSILKEYTFPEVGDDLQPCLFVRLHHFPGEPVRVDQDPPKLHEHLRHSALSAGVTTCQADYQHTNSLNLQRRKYTNL